MPSTTLATPIAVRAFVEPAVLDAASAYWARFLEIMHGLDAVRANHRRVRALLGLREGFALLDVGCGTGGFTRDAALFVAPGGRVSGADVSEALLGVANHRARQSGLAIDYHLADAHDLPFLDASFDGCRTERVLQYLADPDVAIAEMRRVTKPGGRVVASEVDWDGIVVDLPEALRDAWRRAIGAIGNGSGDGWMGRQLRRRFLDAGLVDVTCEGTIMMVTDAETALEQLAVRVSLERARDAGAISANEAEQLIESSVERGRRQRFLLGIPLYTVSGVVPPRA
jgi:SAM-dependent methyltransferase